MGVRKGQSKLSLEEYMAFYEEHRCSDFTINFLNQIISMHGFCKIQHRPKRDLVDHLNSIELMLMPPQRSTLKESITSCAFLSLEQVREDLEALEWKECPVQSIQSLKSTEENLPAADDLQIICASATSDPCQFLPSPSTVESRGSIGKPRPKKKKKKEMAMKTADPDALPKKKKKEMATKTADPDALPKKKKKKSAMKTGVDAASADALPPSSSALSLELC